MAKRSKEEQKIYDEYIKDLKGHEGYKSEVYPDGKDSEGRQLYSVGYGHQLTPEELEMYPPGSKVPKKITDGWFSKDADKFYTLGKAEAAQYGRTDAAAIKGTANAMFNLGEAGFAGFKDMRQAMAEGRWGDVEKHAKDSKWFREDAPTRTQYFVDNMLSPYEKDTKGNIITPQKVEQPGQVAPVEQVVKPIPGGAIQENPVVEKTMPKEESWLSGTLGGIGDWASDTYTKAKNTSKTKEELMKELEAAYASGDTDAVTKAMALMENDAGYLANLDQIDTNMNEALLSKDALYDESGNLIGKGTQAFSKEPIEAATQAVEDKIVEENTLGGGTDWQGSLSDAFRNVIRARDKQQDRLSKIPRASNFSGSVKADLAGLQGVLNARATQFTPYARFGG